MMRAAAARLPGALAVLVLAAGCAHVQPDTEEHDGLRFDERQARLEAIASWEIRGRLAVNTGERAFQGRFSWLQDGTRSTLSVRGPLGGGILEVSGSPGLMTVTARGEEHVLEDPEADLSRLLGWWMPVGSLHAWLLGLPDPQFDAETRVERDTVLRTLEQRLWRLEYDTYQLSEGLLLPRRIDMMHGPLELRVTVDTWIAAGATSRLELPGTGPAK